MFNKFFISVFITLILSGTTAAQYSNTGFIQTPFKIQFNGDALKGVRADGKSNTYGLPSVKDFISKYRTEKRNPALYTVTFVNTGCTTIYDLCSNGSAVQIWQDPSAPDNIHAVFMSAPLGDGTSFPNRKSKYYFSSNRGTSWFFGTDIPLIRSGFPAITGFSDGTALITNHSSDGGSSFVKCQAYKDVYPGLASFTRLDAPGNTGYEWPRVITTRNLSLTNKFLMFGSGNGTDSTKYNICTNVSSTPGTWLGWNTIPPGSSENFAVGRGTDGRLGVAYINNNATSPSTYGDIWFIESTNNGTTFSSPLKIFDANFGAGSDSLGGLRGISITYRGNIPAVVFETIKQTTAGSFFPAAPAKIRFWSSALPGSDPYRSIVIADTLNVGYHPYIGVNDVMSSICRPSIGVSSDCNALFAAFSVPSVYIGGTVDTTTFMDLWFTYSTNGGNNWTAPSKVNQTTPVYDWRYPSISPVNDMSASNYYCNMNILKGIIPGSYVNGSGNGESAEGLWFVRIAIPYTPQPPIPPAQMYPLNYSNTVLPVTLDWDSLTNATSYHLLISVDSLFGTVIFDTVMTKTYHQLRQGLLTVGQRYFWKINAVNINGTSLWSNIWRFMVVTSGIQQLPGEIPARYRLYNNYPNPFNPSTTIKFDLPKSSAVRLSVYDITGREIETLINEKLNAGSYETKWDGSKYAGGVYFCRISSGEFTNTIRMLLIK